MAWRLPQLNDILKEANLGLTQPVNNVVLANLTSLMQPVRRGDV
jgi:hypothetical protein